MHIWSFALISTLLPIFAAAAAALRPEARRGVVATTGVAVAAATAVSIGTVTDPDALRRGVMVAEGTGFAVGLTADRVGAVIAVLTLAVGLVVLAAGSRSFEGDPRARRFAALGAALVGAVAVTALGATLLTVALGWFASGFALLGLLRLGGSASAARDTVRRTASTLAIGDAALAAAVVIAIATVGAIDLRGTADAVQAARTQVGGVGVAELLAVLLVVAGITRSALLPAHRWLPSTVAAPTPVSALLHAGVVNGVGVLVLRTLPVTAESAVAMALLGAAGAATAIGATAVMLSRADAKGALAWSTAGQMGFMAVQLAVGAFASALFHLVGHAMYKAALFLGVGATVRAGAERRHLPLPVTTMARVPRLVLAATVPAVSIAAGFALFSPDLSLGAGLLVIGFGWWTSARLVDGWLASTDRRLAAVGLAIGATAPIVYVGGTAVFKRFVGGSLPAEVTGAVPGAIVVGALVAIAAAAVLGWVLPGPLRERLAARAAGTLVAIGAPPVTRTARRRPAVVATSRPGGDPTPIPLVPAQFHS